MENHPFGRTSLIVVHPNHPCSLAVAADVVAVAYVAFRPRYSVFVAVPAAADDNRLIRDLVDWMYVAAVAAALSRLESEIRLHHYLEFHDLECLILEYQHCHLDCNS